MRIFGKNLIQTSWRLGSLVQLTLSHDRLVVVVFVKCDNGRRVAEDFSSQAETASFV